MEKIRKSRYGLKTHGGWIVGTLCEMLKYIEDYNEEFGNTWRGKLKESLLIKNPKISKNDEVEEAVPTQTEQQKKGEILAIEETKKYFKSIDWKKYPNGLTLPEIIEKAEVPKTFPLLSYASSVSGDLGFSLSGYGYGKCRYVPSITAK